MESFYTELGGGRFLAGEHTAGPWSRDAQHGGPPSALALSEILRAAGETPLHVARMSCELLRPVPVGELTVTVTNARPGRDVQMYDAEIGAGGRPVLLARAWLVTPAPALEHGAVQAPRGPVPPPPDPDGLSATVPAGPQWDGTHGYLQAVEWRYTHGGFHELGPGGAWGRPRVALIDDREATGAVRAMLLADTGSGIGLCHDLHEVQAINVDLTVHFDRAPAGEWIHLDATSTGVPGGGSFSTATLSDQHGPFAHGVQTLLVRRHR